MYMYVHINYTCTCNDQSYNFKLETRYHEKQQAVKMSNTLTVFTSCNHTHHRHIILYQQKPKQGQSCKFTLTTVPLYKSQDN